MSEAEEFRRQHEASRARPQGENDAPPWNYLGVPEGYSARRHTDGRNQFVRSQTSSPNRPAPSPTITVAPHEIPGFYNMTSAQQVEAMRAKAEEKRRLYRSQGILITPPRYTADSPLLTFMNLDPIARAQVQRDLAAAGLMGDYREGIFDSATESALSAVMANANQEGTRWNQSLANIARQHASYLSDQAAEESASAPNFPIPTYLAPDYATLSQAVKSQFRQTLGREPTEAELAGLADELSSFHRQAFEAEVDAAMQDFQSAGIASEGGFTGFPAEDETTVQAVDPIARFQQRFDEVYGKDIAMEEEEAETGRSFANLMASLNVGQGSVGRVV